MSYAIVKDGVCMNTIVADEEFAGRVGAVPCPDGFGIGDFFDGETWTKKEHPEPPEPEPTVDDDQDALLIDLDYRLLLLELEVN